MNKLFLLSIAFSLVLLTSCRKDDDRHAATNPIAIGANVTVTNTFQATAQTAGVETTIEDLFMLPEGALAASASVTNTVEFPDYLLGLYDIDIAEDHISFELAAAVDDPTYGEFFRIIEAGTIDRYYLTFEEPQNVSGFSSSNPSVSLRFDSDKVLVVEIGEGFDFNPGTTFTITLN